MSEDVHVLLEPALTNQDKARLTLTVEEIFTIQAALTVALKEKKVTTTIAGSALDKLDKAVDRWAAS
jgi:hypothetical protein